ncbi:hypothetical protein [Geomonas anaerohicana]|uniref:Uncharacterized protein n=1 Tax=Geomonas anaerohicana TaxID=2798583 RepID=A0ABS0YC62_9BACT|nr:hypothetical protein [Geomonas anaerohicana]MBJ6749898.1 hypothetical protein [Geomonas anaerohicana]
MELKVVINIKKGPAGSLRLEIDAATSGVDVIEALNKSVGRSIEARFELPEETTGRRAKGERQPTSHPPEGLTDCAHGSYWFPKKGKDR